MIVDKYEKIKAKLKKKRGGFCAYCHKQMIYATVYECNDYHFCVWCLPRALKTRKCFKLVKR